MIDPTTKIGASSMKFSSPKSLRFWSHLFALRLGDFFATLVLFSVWRLYFLLAYTPKNLAQESSLPHILEVLAMSVRFDLSYASAITLFLCITSLLRAASETQHLQMTRHKSAVLDWITPIFRMTDAASIALARIFFIVLLITDFYYYYYYKDHFNMFFWEFWNDTENQILVFHSLRDEIPMIRVLVDFCVAIFLYFSVLSFYKKFVAVPLQRWLEHSRWKTPLCFLALVFGIRSTFEVPLAMQRGRYQISKHVFLNTLHTNAVYSLWHSYDLVFVQPAANRRRIQSPAGFSDAFDAYRSYAATDSAYSVNVSSKNDLELRYQVPLVQSQYLKRAPKHIVVILMESMTQWPLDITENNFHEALSPNLQEIKNQGIYFDNAFQTGSGTHDTLMKMTTGIPLPGDFPMETSFKQAHQEFPSSLPHIAKDLQYIPRYFYGGSLGWHGLQYFLDRAGYTNVFGEHSFPKDALRTRFGVHDDSLFQFLTQKLDESVNTKTWDLVLTLSNHPPYHLPKSFKPTEMLWIPKSLQPAVSDPDLLLERFNAYHYADQALGRFFHGAKSKPWFKDTLFVLTADHSHTFGLQFEDQEMPKIKRIPLIFYGPDLIRQDAQWPIHTPAVQMDITPTIASLISPFDLKITSWGRSLLATNSADAPYLLSYYLDCKADICLYKNKMFRKSSNLMFTPCTTADCLETEKVLKALKHAKNLSGTSYFFQRKASNKN